MLNQALDTDFEGYKEFLEYDHDLLANDVEILQLIEQNKQNRNTDVEPIA